MNQDKVRESNNFSMTGHEGKHAGTRDRQVGETETKSGRVSDVLALLHWGKAGFFAVTFPQTD